MKKIALVTGANSYLATKIIEFLNDEDFVVYGGVREPKNTNQGYKQVRLDVTSDRQCKSAVNKIIETEGRLDVLINVAGVTKIGFFDSFTADDFKQILDVNVIGPFRMTKYSYKFLKKQKNAKIINITSMVGLVAFPNYSLYSASKFALEALTSSLSFELAKDDINVTSIAPGAIKSPKKVNFKNYRPLRERFFLVRILFPMVTAEEIAKAIGDIIDQKNPPSRLVLGRDARLIYLISKVLPDIFWDNLIKLIWRRK